jgi:carboxyl-terminal processing protease
VARVVDADGDLEELRTRGTPRFDGPVVLLVDAATASAAEVFASGLRASGRAILVGHATYGKRAINTLHVKPDGRSELAHVLSWLGEDGCPLVPDLILD